MYPNHVTLFISNKYFKIFKFIGAVSLSIILLKSRIGLEINFILYNIIWGFAVSYTITRLVLVFYALKQGIYYIFTGKLIVRNSPLNFAGTIARFMYNGLKSTSQTAIGTGFAISSPARYRNG